MKRNKNQKHHTNSNKYNRWNVSLIELLNFPEGSLGFKLGCFLQHHHFEDQPEPEAYDVLHVLTNTGNSVMEEIGLNYYLLGNGKRSIRLFLNLFLGTLLCPLQLNYFIKQFKKGTEAHHFHYIDFSKLLLQPIKTIQETFSIK